MTLKSVGVWSCGKIAAAVYGAMGLLIGAIFAVISLFGAAIGSAASGSGEAWFGALFGVGAVIFMPLCYAFFGFIGAIIGAVIYNLAAQFVGGVELELV